MAPLTWIADNSGNFQLWKTPELFRLFDRRGEAYFKYASRGDRATWAILVGLGRFELPTSPLSGVRSNQLSYRPNDSIFFRKKTSFQACARYRKPVDRSAAMYIGNLCWALASRRCLLFKGGDPAAGSPTATLLRLHPSHESHRGSRPPEG